MYHPNMFSRTLSTFILTGALLSSLAYGQNAASHSSSLPSPRILESRDKRFENQRLQQNIGSPPVSTFDIDRDNPRYSKPDFPGDETGNSPFFYCPESDPDNDLFVIDKIVLNPNPPHIDQVWVFHAHGYFREWINNYHDPFRVRAHVRNEDRDALDFTIDYDFCDFVDVVEMDGRGTTCPPDRGYGTIHKFEFVDWGISEACSTNTMSEVVAHANSTI